jgi:UDP-N-acetylglucosamine 2-epimerase
VALQYHLSTKTFISLVTAKPSSESVLSEHRNKKVLHVVGARPNFMKIAPIMREVAARSDSFEQILVHTGQHSDSNMSQIFFDDLGIPTPDVNLEVGSGTHTSHVAQIMMRLEPIARDVRPDWLVVARDVNQQVPGCGTDTRRRAWPTP